MSNSLPTLSPLSEEPINLKLEPLTPSSFAEFGVAITAPFPPSSIPPRTKAPLTLSEPPRPAHPDHQVPAVFANQKSALKTAPISTCENLYPDTTGSNNNDQTIKIPGESASTTTAQSRPLVSMFTCFPRQLEHNGTTFKVKILERHPYTTQTFIPLGLGPSRGKRSAKTKFLVIVAPSLPGDSSSQALKPENPPIQNPPDLSKVRAFIAEGDMAVTYAAGTWHAPMVVIGEERVNFVVVQFVDGTSRDVEEVLIGGDIGVDVSRGERDDGLWKPKGRGKRRNKRELEAKL